MLSAIGALLMFIPAPFLGIVGLILLMIGMKGLSDYYRDQSIYGNALRGIIFGIIGVIAVAVIWILGVFSGSLFAALSLGIAGAITAGVAIIAAVVVAFVFYLLMAMNFRRAFNALEQHSGEHLFHTAGTLLWIGAILTIIIVGAVLVWIAFLIAAIAFFSMRLAPTQQPYQQQPYGSTPPPPPPPTGPATRYCPNCGAPVDQNATFCPNCGKQLPPA